MMGQGLVDRQQLSPVGRGRPGHRYQLTEKGRRQTGANFADLSVALWQEIRAIQDPEVRRGLLGRVAKTLATMYTPQVQGQTTAERMRSVSRLFADRDVPLDVEESGKLPVLTALACPYPQLAEQDRGICALERMMLSELVGDGLTLSSCRLDGDACCRFTAN
jgi:predicted ArsR family transcriptional regulator